MSSCGSIDPQRCADPQIDPQIDPQRRAVLQRSRRHPRASVTMRLRLRRGQSARPNQGHLASRRSVRGNSLVTFGEDAPRSARSPLVCSAVAGAFDNGVVSASSGADDAEDAAREEASAAGGWPRRAESMKAVAASSSSLGCVCPAVDFEMILAPGRAEARVCASAARGRRPLYRLCPQSRRLARAHWPGVAGAIELLERSGDQRDGFRAASS